jgi:hypothetical protein
MGLLRRLFGGFGRPDLTNAPEAAGSIAHSGKSVSRTALCTDAAADELQLILLSRFLKCRPANDVPPHWSDLLGESPGALIHRYIECGDLVPVSLAAAVEHCSTVAELKQLLRVHRLKTAGRKRELVQRLIAADEAGISALYAGRRIVECSAEVRGRVERYLAAKKREYERLLADARAALGGRDFAKASILLAEYESRQLNTEAPNPLGISAGPRAVEADVAALKQIFSLRPKILRALPESEWEPLHAVTGLNYLLGGRVSAEALPSDFVGVPNLNPHAVVRMMVFRFKHLRDLERMRSIGVREARIMACGGDSCGPCQQLEGKRFALDKLPELPYEKCTREVGCRCLLTAVIPGFDR